MLAMPERAESAPPNKFEGGTRRFARFGQSRSLFFPRLASQPRVSVANRLVVSNIRPYASMCSLSAIALHGTVTCCFRVGNT